MNENENERKELLEKVMRIAPPEMIMERLRNSLQSAAQNIYEFRLITEMIFSTRDGNLQSPDPKDLDEDELKEAMQCVEKLLFIVKDSRDDLTKAMMIISQHRHEIQKAQKG